ncbi:RsmD family RNA methyltransferase [Polluticaenibacter yanchengensis]|uniref:RsmD family RNA methyltransferase n=1 Tax=Polluticaenibacter yanchengensis TaxID=3014562 RepID=A0ABT4UIY7_9BACT|nr:RsmD family RNA methyltransferase [Chitinophagaceae bacterium LY-5]
MRIIGGKHGGRKIVPPVKMPYTRPTTDIAKEGLFNILQNQVDFEGMKTLDLFGGTGAITYELASRGASDLTIVEKDPKMADFIKQNIEKLALENCNLIRGEVFKFLETCSNQYDFIFAGPPYALDTIDELPKIIVENGLIAEDGVFVLEHTPRNNYKQFKGYFKERNYGTTIFSFFERV